MKKTEKTKIENFDFKKFKEYVETYNYKKDGLNSPVTSFLDMLYGIGISTDGDEFLFADGFKKFKKFVGNLK